MPQPLVSVIVPAYNAAGCISRCVESITSQSYPELEILLLNDGSTDDTLAICRKLAETDPRIRVVDKPNTGAADTRSCGLALAHGEYIQFADSDDHLLPGCTANLVAAMQRSHADLVLAPYRMMVPRKDGGYDIREYSLLPAGVYNKVDYLWQLTGNAAAFYYGVLWNKLYRRDLIQMAHIRFEHVVYAEDQLFNTRYLQVAQRFAAIDEAAYCYIQNPQSVCHTQVSAADMLRHRSRMYHTYKEMCIQLGVYDKFRLRLLTYHLRDRLHRILWIIRCMRIRCSQLWCQIFQIRQINIYQPLQLPQTLRLLIATAVVNDRNPQSLTLRTRECPDDLRHIMSRRDQIDIVGALFLQLQENLLKTGF